MASSEAQAGNGSTPSGFVPVFSGFLTFYFCLCLPGPAVMECAALSRVPVQE
jgi:hypothetical protein